MRTVYFLGALAVGACITSGCGGGSSGANAPTSNQAIAEKDLMYPYPSTWRGTWSENGNSGTMELDFDPSIDTLQQSAGIVINNAAGNQIGIGSAPYTENLNHDRTGVVSLSFHLYPANQGTIDWQGTLTVSSAGHLVASNGAVLDPSSGNADVTIDLGEDNPHKT